MLTGLSTMLSPYHKGKIMNKQTDIKTIKWVKKNQSKFIAQEGWEISDVNDLKEDGGKYIIITVTRKGKMASKEKKFRKKDKLIVGKKDNKWAVTERGVPWLKKQPITFETKAAAQEYYRKHNSIVEVERDGNR